MASSGESELFHPKTPFKSGEAQGLALAALLGIGGIMHAVRGRGHE